MAWQGCRLSMKCLDAPLSANMVSCLRARHVLKILIAAKINPQPAAESMSRATNCPHRHASTGLAQVVGAADIVVVVACEELDLL